MRLRTLVLALALTGLVPAPRALVAQGMPSPHDSTWILGHADQATGPTCAMCHQREFCSSCHVNARNIEAIRTMPSSDSAAAQYRTKRWTYPQPPSHRAGTWATAHAATARENPTFCSTCHSRESCMGCHRSDERLLSVALLPRRARGGARGVDLSSLRPASHTPTWAREHREMAAAGAQACRSCHTQSFCSTCHDGAARPTFHQTDYVVRHGQDAFNRETDCVSCHQPQAFCVSCHQTTGRARTGGTAAAYHNDQPQWVLVHGRLARRSIETCQSCHRQTDCLKCHSPAGYAKVNPHPAGLDLGRLQTKNPSLCRVCHTTGTPPLP